MADKPLKRAAGEAPAGTNPEVPVPTGAERLRAVLFVDISGSTGMYDTLGDTAALAIITRALELLEEQVYDHRGQVVKTIGDELLCLFPDASTAATAAIAMHQSIEHYAASASVPVTIKVGFHSGPVIEERGDVFGDAVNVAARMVEIANSGQIITDGPTLTGMRATFRRRSRAIDRLAVKGKSGEIDIVEIGWRRRGGAPSTTEQAGHPMRAARRASITLTCGERSITLDSGHASFTIGRDPSNSLVVASRRSSRQHARIEWRRDKFVLFDHSTNGTYVTIEGEREVMVKRESFALRAGGVLSIGESAKPDGDGLVRFRCE